jgi:uncharacterized protein YyaL (SSP411 family)
MHTLLKSQSEDPVSDTGLIDIQEYSCFKKTGLSPGLRQKLLCMHVTSFDWERGGLRTPIKFLDRDSIEYSLTQAASYNKNEERMANLSLNNGMDLLDADNGGIYQFATQNCWHQSHYSKTMAAQAGSMRIYSLAYALFHEHAFLKTARNICTYLAETLLTREGVFRSVITDPVVCIDKSRRNKNRNGEIIKTRENGWGIEALASQYEFSGDQTALEMAKQAAEWISSEHALLQGGFKPDKTRQNCLYLSDNLAMARAFLQLYRVTTDKRYLKHAIETADFICSHFLNHAGGFNTGVDACQNKKITQQIDENICTSRFFNLLGYYTENTHYLDMAKHGLSYLALPRVATSRMEEAGILLLDEELSSTPLKVVIFGDKNDRKAAKLFQSALRSFGWYKVVQWHSS